jgi:hypothetical protein
MKEAAKIAAGALIVILVLLGMGLAAHHWGLDLMKETSGPTASK